MLRIIGALPLLGFPALLYALVALFGGDDPAARMAGEIMSFPMVSGQPWRISLGGFILTLALLCFFADILRSAAPSRKSMGRNVVSALAFIPALILFLLVRGFATTEFFLIMLMLLLSFLADATLLVLTSRRTVEIDHS